MTMIPQVNPAIKSFVIHSSAYLGNQLKIGKRLMMNRRAEDGSDLSDCWDLTKKDSYCDG